VNFDSVSDSRRRWDCGEVSNESKLGSVGESIAIHKEIWFNAKTRNDDSV
jgi:hypothetical protein